MNKKMKLHLKEAFDAPKTTRKQEFLMSLNLPKATQMDFILSQIGFIRKRVWLVSCLSLIAGLLGLHHYKVDSIYNSIWVVSSLFPFIALVAVTEIARSASFHMEELEMSCKHSYANVILVRLCILGIYNFVVFGFVLLLFMGKTDVSIILLGMYLITPFLLTCSLSLYILNHMHPRDTIYICGGIASFISLINSFLTVRYMEVIMDRYLKFWSILSLILIFVLVKEAIQFIKKTEELQWNFSLID